MAYTKKNPFLNESDAVYGEHFNNSSLLAGMFSMIGQVNIPSQFESGLFNTTETKDKALFLKIGLENLTGTNNGDSIILNTGQSFTLNTKVVLSLFKSWKRFNVTGEGVDIDIDLYDEDNDLIRNVGNNQELTNYNITNESIKVVITANSSCTISNILFEVTTRKWDNNSSVTIPQEQINGLKEWEQAKNQQINEIDSSKVPTSREINNKPLTSDIILTSSDVGAQPLITTETKTITLKAAGEIGNSTTNGQVLTLWYRYGAIDGFDYKQDINILTGSNIPSFSKKPLAIKGYSINGTSIISNWVRVLQPTYAKELEISVRIEALLTNFMNTPLTMTIECYVI